MLDNFSSGSRDNLAAAAKTGRLDVVEGYIRDLGTVERAARGCAVVFQPGGDAVGAALDRRSARGQRAQRHRHAERTRRRPRCTATAPTCRSAYAVLIPRFTYWALHGETLEVHGDGEQSRDFTYIDNVVEANVLAARAAGAGGEVFNVGYGACIRGDGTARPRMPFRFPTLRLAAAA